MPETTAGNDPQPIANPDFATGFVGWVKAPDTRAIRLREEQIAREQQPIVAVQAAPAAIPRAAPPSAPPRPVSGQQRVQSGKRVVRRTVTPTTATSSSSTTPSSSTTSKRTPPNSTRPAPATSKGAATTTKRAPIRSRKPEPTRSAAASERPQVRPSVRYSRREIEALKAAIEVAEAALRF